MIIITTNYSVCGAFPFETSVKVSSGFSGIRKLGASEVCLKGLLIRSGFPDSAEDDQGLAYTFQGNIFGVECDIDNLPYNLLDS